MVTYSCKNMIVFHDQGREQPPTANDHSATLHSVDNHDSAYSDHESSNERDDSGPRSETLAERTIPVGGKHEGRLVRREHPLDRLVTSSGVVCITQELM